MYDIRLQEDMFTTFFFVSFYTLSIFVFLNLFVAILLEAFEREFDDSITLDLQAADLIAFKNSEPPDQLLPCNFTILVASGRSTMLWPSAQFSLLAAQAGRTNAGSCTMPRLCCPRPTASAPRACPTPSRCDTCESSSPTCQMIR